MSIKVGDFAPNFKLYSTEKKEVSLSDFKGKDVVILFFPAAFTGVCTTELCTMRDNFDVYKGLNAEIIAISVDSMFTLEKFKEENKLPFTVLSDYNKETAASYGALYEEFLFGMKGVAKRSAFVVDKEGKIKYAEVLEDAHDLPNFDNIKAALS